MSGDADGTHLTFLGRTDEVGLDDLAERYRYPDGLRACWVRANMIMSADGGATSAGKSGALGGAGDRAVFTSLRDLADVVIVGASTARVENYSGAQVSATGRAARRRRGQSEVPPIAVLTRSGDLDADAALFHHTSVAPLILTSSRAADDTRRRLGSLAEVIDASAALPDSVDLATALAMLAERGLLRVLAEGGPGILGMFTQADLLDELCITVAPVMLGGAPHRIVTGDGEVRHDMRLAHALGDDAGYLYLRYQRRRDGTAG
ncbi:riboflavin biosynthesis pyrimidine reductase [Mycolicibacterium iranicum]|uniref:Riboflavin biosynthesis pyrimidine reductase n=1 Tax=Mycolicibacterium iranicum TaxID=912594 RepID=A0A839Q451_MYCIR|nr:pyrimidine reductase family protein [Mycolicibacterium iranicum]MBB2990233.1 riboflavin biosynthesis pyrimidine reductase [Mycolicibacterium iranicum]